jgi:hypothetical protein
MREKIRINRASRPIMPVTVGVMPPSFEMMP